MSNKIQNIEDTDLPRVIVVGAGFAGLKLVRLLAPSAFQIVLLDKNNYHQFQPLFYQIATAGLEPSAISFPIRKLFQNQPNVHFRMGSLLEVNPDQNSILTDIGEIKYDHLVLCIGADTNFFGNEQIKKYAIPMKTVGEALYLRNRILENFEKALNESDIDRLDLLMNIVVVGGGPTGVELAGALAEMKKFVLPKDYPELDFERMKITLLEGSGRLLNGMSESAGTNARDYLTQLNVDVQLNSVVKTYDGKEAVLASGAIYRTKSLLWAAGIQANRFKGLNEDLFARGGRIIVDRYSRVKGSENIYALGDLAYMETPRYKTGHPQVAQVAIQQATRLYRNSKRILKNKKLKEFEYKDKGSMATVGRNLAVCDLPIGHLKGFVAWVLWLFVHLMAILGAKNKLFVFINWSWNYLTYDQSLRLLIRHKNDNVVNE
ncbi:MAG: NAD(P)/FAD-dependent oxidoreductase [Flavobacteriales bacterium]|nr:NAD(P)/FAD-dependent oxidoreductase [Flavobacteriales bacterium]